MEHHIEIFARTTHDVSKLQILQDIGSQAEHLILMGCTEIDIIIEDGALAARILQKAYHLRTDDGVDGIIGAKHDDVIAVDLGIGEVQTVIRMVLVEDILCIVVLVEKRQRDRRLRVGIDIDTGGIDTILLEKRDDTSAHTVVAGLADKRCTHARTSQRYQAVEH